MNKRIMGLGALAITAVMLAGCGTSATKTASEPQKTTLTMGTNAQFQPFEFVTKKNPLIEEYDGIDVAIAMEIAKDAGMNLHIEDQEFDGLIAAVSTDKIDMAVAGMTVTEERKQSVDFSDPYYTATQVMVVSPDNTSIKKAADLKDKKVGVVLGYTGDNIVTKDIGVPESNIQRANRGLDIIQDVKNGKLDAVVIDSYTGKALAEKNGLVAIEDPDVFESEEYAIAVKKGNKELLDKINKTLKRMKDSGEIEKLAEKYNTMASE